MRGKLIASGEDLHGISTDHNALREVVFMVGQVDQQPGKVWIAQVGGYVVNALGWAGGTMREDGVVKGRATLEFTLEGINQTVIARPAACANFTLQDLPELPSARMRYTSPKSLTIESKISSTKVIAFYQQGLPASGWILDDSSDPSSVDMRATRAGVSIFLSVSPQEPGCQVNFGIP
jgi:hypothetical protein